VVVWAQSVIAYRMKDYSQAYHHVKEVCAANPYNIPLWNFFNRFLTFNGRSVKGGHLLISQRRFLIRLLAQHHDSIPLIILAGNISAMSGSYRLALGQYFLAYQQMPEDPFLNFILGVSLLMVANSKNEPNFHAAITKAFSFLFKYRRLAGDTTETNYNLGRAFHHCSLFHMAIPYYERAIKLSIEWREKTCRKRLEAEMEVLLDGDEEDAGAMELNLERESAFNLALIYRNSGNEALARQLLREHLTV